MKPRWSILFALALICALILPGAVSADTSAPPAPAYAGVQTGQPAPPQALSGEESKHFGRALDAPAALSPDLMLGQPGLSFRYDRTLGEAEAAYLEDDDHFYDVEGIGTDGANVWVTDSWGSRVVKFNDAGGFLQKIGKAGFRDSSGASLDYLTDVAVDSGGNIWVVDGGANHVVKYDSTGKVLSELGQAWSAGSDNAHFNSPISIAFDAAGNVYVSDSGLWGEYGNHRVQVFDSSGNYRATIGQTGVTGSDNNHLNQPRHIAVFGNQLYVADAGNQRVQIFNISNPAAPAYAATLGLTGAAGSDNAHLDSPEGVAVDANFIYVADANNQRVQVLNRTTRTYVATIGAGTYGTDNNHFNHPTDVAIDTTGNIYVADNWNKRVQQYSAGRVYRRTYGTTGVSYATDAYHYYFPNGVALGKDGSTYITEGRGHRLVKLDANGVAQWSVGQPGQSGNDAEHLCWTQDVAVDIQGRVYLTQNGCDTRVRIFNSAGALEGYLATGWGAANDQLDGPQGLTVDQGNYIYVADSSNQRVQIFGPNRAYVATLGQTGVAGSDNGHFNYPTDVAVGSDGTIYVADEGNDRVQVYNSSRQYVRTIGGGGTGSDFGHFEGWGPNRLAVDAQNRLYVADSGNNRVQVFDATGAYLTTVGGSWGPRTGQMRGPHGLAIGPDGALYVADYDNDRVQKFAIGVPGWKQVNINGFGDRWATWISSLLPFQGSLYTAGYPARVWKMTAGGAWSQASSDGFGDAANNEIDALAEFGNQLYAATYTWVCDDPNCSSGHSNGPQIWRSPNGATWTNVTPAGGICQGNCYVASFAVFKGQLYIGLGVGYTHGAEIWRTADGVAWTRVAANGFTGDVYTTDITSLLAYNGSLYAGTRHGDYSQNDGHPDAPLGGEIWRSEDGTTWTRANAPGFGNPNAYRIEKLLAFRNGVYAYVSHWGATPGGAEVWRCAMAVCSGQGDWSQVVSNGFGVPENQFLYAGAATGDHLYAAVQNNSTGVQLWRTENGADWTKATPYDGLGNSNNSYVYRHAMTAFNNRLIFGVNNSANGAEIWATALTADFTATPSRGRPPLSVQFNNTSAGDYTTSQWDFGDGQISAEKNPAHTYAGVGTYTVKLTVGNGTDSDTVTRPAAVRVGYTVYLPTVTRNWDPLMYDNFDNPQWDGAWNPAKWAPDQGSTVFRQQAGALVMTEPAVPNPTGGSLHAVSPQFRSWKQTQQIGARFKVSSDRTGGWSPIGIAFVEEEVNGHGWYAACRLGGSAGNTQASFGCSIFIREGDNYPSKYETNGFPVDYDTWCTARIETDPNTGNVKFYLNNAQIGSHAPADGAALVASEQMRIFITNWGGSPNSSATRYVDDVRITPAK